MNREINEHNTSNLGLRIKLALDMFHHYENQKEILSELEKAQQELKHFIRISRDKLEKNYSSSIERPS